jgi:hypothetical protein
MVAHWNMSLSDMLKGLSITLHWKSNFVPKKTVVSSAEELTWFLSVALFFLLR